MVQPNRVHLQWRWPNNYLLNLWARLCAFQSAHANVERWAVRGMLLVFFCLQFERAFAQSSPPYVIQGPAIVLSHVNIPGCRLENENFGTGKLTNACVSISYDTSQPTSASIAQNRYVLVPRGNLLFQFPIVCNTVGSDVTVDFGVGVRAVGPNSQDGTETSSGSGGWTVLHPAKASAATVQIPIIVDWAENVVTFSMSVDVRVCPPSRDPEHPCYVGSGQFTGPDLSSISLGTLWPPPFTLPNDAFLLIATPAAAFQLPVLPTTILYGPLGNGPQAKSTFTVTNITATNQEFTNSQGGTAGMIQDDKTQYQVGATLSLSMQRQGVVCGGSGCKISAGFNYSWGWDHSTETENETTYGRTGSVENEHMIYQTRDALPPPGQPSLDRVTWATQPFWGDVVLAVTDAQYAVWDYPAGPVIQPLGSAQILELPLRQMDHCANSPKPIEPVSITPQQWVHSGLGFEQQHTGCDDRRHQRGNCPDLEHIRRGYHHRRERYVDERTSSIRHL